MMTTSHFNLRPYQKECLEAIPEKGSWLIQMATGTGKTVTFSQVPRHGRMLIISHRKELVNQPVKYFDVPVGIEQGSRTSNGEEVISASIQSLTHRYEKFPKDYFDVIITDEAHHAAAPSYQRIYSYFTPRLHLGFTATPNRHDKVGLYPIFERVIFEYGLRRGIEEGYLCDINCLLARVQIDFNSVRSRLGDFISEDLESVMLKESNVKAIIQAYKTYAKGQTLIFAAGVEHAQRISNRIPGSKVVLGSTPPDERDAIIQDFKDGKIHCLVNCMVLTEGTDLPNIESIIIARPTQSEALYQQMVGRGTRQYPGKDKLNLIDVVGITQCHRLCTAPVLLGIDPSLVPVGLRSNIQGDLLSIEERVNRNTDVFDNWIRSAELVDLWAKEENIDTHNINFTRMPDGSLKVLDYYVPPSDALGGSQQEFIDNVFYKLQTKEADKAALWDLNIIRYWENQPATEKQKWLANKLTERKYKNEIEKLNKFQASQVISRLSR